MDAGRYTAGILNGTMRPAKARRTYCNMVRDSTAIFWRIIKNYYRHPFRELFLNGRGPLQVHRATYSLLAGHVFPRPAWALRWRMQFFWLCMFLQRRLPLVPFRKPCRLLDEQPVEMPNLTATAHAADYVAV